MGPLYSPKTGSRRLNYQFTTSFGAWATWTFAGYFGQAVCRQFFVAGSQPRTVQSLTDWTILHLTLVMCSVRGEDNNIYYAEVRSQSL